MFARPPQGGYDYIGTKLGGISPTGPTNEVAFENLEQVRDYDAAWGNEPATRYRYNGRIVTYEKLLAIEFTCYRNFVKRINLWFGCLLSWEPIVPVKCTVDSKFPGHLRKFYQHRHRGNIGAKNFCRWSN
jgi:hypothetical protein